MMASIDKLMELEKPRNGELGGLDLDTAKLDDMSQALARLEFEKRGLLENIRVLRVRLADEKVKQTALLVLHIACNAMQQFSSSLR